MTGLVGGGSFSGVATSGTLTGKFTPPAETNFTNIPSGDEAVLNYATPNAVALVVGSATVSVAFAPSSVGATTGQPLTVNAVPPIPPSGNQETLTYVWYKNGVQVQPPVGTNPTPTLLTSDTLSSSVTTKRGDVIMVVVTPFDGTTAGASVSTTMTIADAPPAVTITLTSNTPTVTPLSTLTATASTSDPDGDPVTLTYVWSRFNPTTNTTTVVQTTPTTGTTNSLNDVLQVLGNASPGQTITVTVTPNDGITNGTAATMSLLVGATPPTATVNLTPANPTVGTTLTATATTADLNGLPVMLEYDWFLNNGTTPIQTDTVSTLSDTLTPANTALLVQGNIVSVEVIPSDSAATGVATAPASVTIGAVLPTATVRLTPLPPSAGQAITATATTADTDGNPVALVYEWFRNGTLIQTTPATGTTTSLTDTYNFASTDHSGDLIVVTVTPYATLPNNTTQQGAAVSATTYIAGSAATVRVSLSPASPAVTQQIVATAVPFDPDGAPVTLQYQWYLNNSTTPVQTDSTSNTTDTLTVTPPRGTVVTVVVTPTAEGLIGAVGSSSVTVVSSQLVATVALSPPSPVLPAAGVPDVLTATVTASNADGDPISYTYLWSQTSFSTKATTPVQTTLNSSSNTDTLDLSKLPAGSVNKNDTFTVQVIPTDKTTNISGQATTTFVLVASTLPVATVNVTPGNPTVTDTLTATATATDPNSLPVTLTYQWFDTPAGSTTPNPITMPFQTQSGTNTLSLATVANIKKGDTITVNVTPSDSMNPGPVAAASTTVVDSLPVATVLLNPANPTTNQILTATATAQDADNDVVTLIYKWFRTDPVTGITAATPIQTTGPTTSLTDQLNLSTAGFGGKGAGISVQVTPFDGTFSGSMVSASTTIAAAAPVAQDATTSISHNDLNYPTGVTIPLTATDVDTGDTLTYSLYTANGTLTNGGAADGTVTINAQTGVATYTPTGTTVGTDTFQYVASVGTTLTSFPATVTINLTNTPPTVTDHNYNVTQNTPFTLSGLLNGAQDADNDPLTVVNVPTATAHGTITLNAQGAYVYTPATGYTGIDNFSYQASDGTANSTNVGTVTLNVQDIAPIANNVTYPPFTQGTTLTENKANGLIAMGTTGTGSNGVTLMAQLAIGGQAAHGIAVINPDGSFTYTPALSTYIGTDSFMYSVSDGTDTTPPPRSSSRSIRPCSCPPRTPTATTRPGTWPWSSAARPRACSPMIPRPRA